MLTAIAIVIIIVAVKLVLNYRAWLQKKPVNHAKEWIIMVLASVPSIILFTKASALTWYFSAPLSAVMISFFIWLFFDGIYNKLRGFNWWFTGSDDADDAATDNFLQRLKLWQHIVLKIAGVIISITLYIIVR